ncbi:hypothetical protein GCM10009424_06370 [Sphingomonas ursincola]|uniref:Tetratricopeptide repeat protein n=1 Tax=Sphingomonas ursincola TaxID=56361 RepID=A0A7V8RF90_9SPHN|nr:hypothetical protein [Sphingomonas ursincola]MBA1375371.1 hypothetical protein [Sphingomonas ursincola]MBA4781530.1 hypothetical protein [Blastomonas sp.]MCH2239554.1 hypothetical protein [Blastomonas sp.]
MRRISRFNMALMLALAGTTAVSLALPVDGAFAQRTEKKGKKGKDEAPQMELSAEFRNAFSAAQTAFGASDFVTAEAKLNEAAAVAASADEKYLTGKLTLQIGLKKNDEAMQMKGIEQALASGKSTDAEKKTFNSFIGEKALLKNDFARARQYLTAAVEAGQNGPVNLFQLAEAHFGEAIAKSGGRSIDATNAPIAAAGLPYLQRAVEADLAGTKQYSASWAKRGFQIARATKTDSSVFANLLLRADAGKGAWHEVVQAVQADNRNFTSEQNLDAMRLLRMAGGMTSASDYQEYIEAAGAARRPTEVIALIEEGKAAGIITDGNAYFKDALATASGARGEYVATLPESVRDSRGKATATVTLATADALLANKQYAEAEELAGIAVTKGATDKERALMVQAIAQVAQGKYEPARQTLAGVTGVRAPLAKLWTLYIDQKAGAGATAPAA